ncbi:MAG: prolipoprotein diacylglyceryl transferase [Spirochaetes bacterium]|nr:prolipoprotein diacylglyceryl transferase [Spirochaetota bacterium]
MYPILFQYKFITIGGYGVMLAIGIYLAYILFERELIVRDINPDLAYKILLVAIPAGIIGSKVFHILDHMDEFLADPAGTVFSGAGLSIYGGLLFALFFGYFIIKRSNEPVLKILDIAAPCIAIGYGFGRIGCHIAGDGCYGIETSGILGVAYPNGIVPTSYTVYPTPLFESFFSFIVAILLLQLRKKELSQGTLFFIYLILNGVPRFFVEFIRRNPIVFGGLTQAQLIALGLIIAGIAGIVIVNHKKLRNA